MKNKKKVFWILASIPPVMFCLGFGMVPIYKRFCRPLQTQGVRNVFVATKIPIRVRFNADVGNGVLLKFRPEKQYLDTYLGVPTEVIYDVKNVSNRRVNAMANYSVGPDIAEDKLKKLKCFCFTKQSFLPHESRKMPVTFVINPSMAQDNNTKDIHELTLSYTFYDIDQKD